MQIKASEVSDVIKKEIENAKEFIDISETGTVLSVGDGIARVYGLTKVMANELVQFESGVMGMALNLEEDNVGIVILGDDKEIKELMARALSRVNIIEG